MKRLILAFLLLPSLAFAQQNFVVQLSPHDYEVVSKLFGKQTCDEVCDTWVRIQLQIMQQQHDQAVRQLAQEQQAVAARAVPSGQGGRVFTPAEPSAPVTAAPKPESPMSPTLPHSSGGASSKDGSRTSPWPMPPPAETPAQR